MSKVLATIGGTALVPGVSKNRRLYTSGAVARAVARAQERIDAGDEDFTSMTHHDARDDSTRIVGRLTSMTLGEDGSARFTADIADTEHGRTIAALADNTDGKPFLKGVSIRGYWLGKVRTEKGPDGQEVSTANDVELDGIDFTKSPGVAGAKVQAFRWAGAGDQENETTERVLITETLSEARVTFTEDAAEPGSAPVPPIDFHALRDGACVHSAAEANLTPYGAKSQVDYADPGYQPDKKARYPIDTKAHAKSAWAYVSQQGNASKYTPAQLKRVKARIMRALKGFGVKVNTKEADLRGWCFTEAAPLAETMPVEAGCGEDQCGSFSVNASNGPLNITLSCWQMDPADLDIIVAAAAKAAGAALKMLDPDLDGDIDVPGAGPGNDPDQDAPDETDPGDGGDLDGPVTTTPATAPAAGNTEERTVMTTSTETAAPAGTTPAAPPPAAPVPAGITQEQLDAAVAAAASRAATEAVAASEAQRKARKAARETAQPGQPAAPAAPAQPPAVPAAPAATETDEQVVARLVAERLAADPIAAQAAAPAVTPATETADQRMARLGALVDAKLTEAKQALVASGQVSVARAGLTTHAPIGEDAAASGGGGVNAWGLPSHFPNKPPHEYNEDETQRYLAASLTAHYLGDKADKIA